MMRRRRLMKMTGLVFLTGCLHDDEPPGTQDDEDTDIQERRSQLEADIIPRPDAETVVDYNDSTAEGLQPLEEVLRRCHENSDSRYEEYIEESGQEPPEGEMVWRETEVLSEEEEREVDPVLSELYQDAGENGGVYFRYGDTVCRVRLVSLN